VITIEKQTFIPLFLSEFDLLTFYEIINIMIGNLEEREWITDGVNVCFKTTIIHRNIRGSHGANIR